MLAVVLLGRLGTTVAVNRTVLGGILFLFLLLFRNSQFVSVSFTFCDQHDLKLN